MLQILLDNLPAECEIVESGKNIYEISYPFFSFSPLTFEVIKNEKRLTTMLDNIYKNFLSDYAVLEWEHPIYIRFRNDKKHRMELVKVIELVKKEG